MKKKLVIIFLVIIALVLAAIYIFIPSNITISSVKVINCTNNGTLRMVLEKKNWVKWYPGSITAKNDINHEENPVFVFNDEHFKPGRTTSTSIEVDIQHNDKNIKSLLTVLSLNLDTTALEWQSLPIRISGNPFRRIEEYYKAKGLKKNMDAVLTALADFLNKETNVYSMDIRKMKVKDSILIATRFITAKHPSTNEIYTAINKLKIYINKEGARENNSPMVHTDRLDSNRYQTMVAIPVNKELKQTNGMFVKRMVLGFILEAEVKGGAATVEKSLGELENYRSDYQMASPAIPFELLITDRSQEADTTKWITRIYYPVF